MQISVVVISYNEERNLGRCLASVQEIADEIIVLDSFSTDGTVAIAERYGAKVFTNAFKGHIEQKNLALNYASNRWVLSLDADEAIDVFLKQSILDLKQRGPDDNIAGYRMNRLTNYCGKWIKHSGWYPDTKTRLFNKTTGKWGGENPHDKWEAAGTKFGKLKGDLLHYSFYTINEHLQKIERYTEIAAKQRISKGKRYNLLKIGTVPVWVFILNYIFRLGFMDGYYGYIVCKLQAFETWLKYNKVRIYSQDQSKA